MKKWIVLIPALLWMGCSVPLPDDTRRTAELEEDLQFLMEELGIPGMSVLVARGDSVLLSRGFGYSNKEDSIPARPETIYHLASLTKTFTAVVMMQLVEEGKLDLDTPISAYGIEIDSPHPIRVRHLLSHTSGQDPGTFYEYNSTRYGMLAQIQEEISGESLAEAMTRRILDPLGLDHTFPNFFDSTAFVARKLPIRLTSDLLMRGYIQDSSFQQIPAPLETGFGASAGLMSNVNDLFHFSRAIDKGLLLLDEARTTMLTPAVSPTGEKFPYALGWFVTAVGGHRLEWHYGYWFTNSSLILRVPDADLVFIVLANTDLISRAALNIGDGNILHSAPARAFLRAFVLDPPPERIDFRSTPAQLEAALQSNPDHREFQREELMGLCQMAQVVGKSKRADSLWNSYDHVFAGKLPDEIDHGQLLAKLDHLGNDTLASQTFSLTEAADVMVYAVGEGFPGDRLYDFGWITRGQDTVWTMEMTETGSAGGDLKNRRAQTKLSLPAGDYVVHFQTDATHAFHVWNAEPPEWPFYGIVLLLATGTGP